MLRRAAVWLPLTAILCWSLALRLGFGLRVVHGDADHDERYNLANVAKVVTSGEWRPANGYYSVLSWAPQAAIVAGIERFSPTTESGRPIRFDARRPTPFVIYLFRTVQALYGTALVFVIFLLARELSGTPAGLLAAALASSTWLYVWAGSWFKPDGLAALATALATLWSVRAILRPTLPRHLLAGVGVGLAASAKLTAALAALPLVLAAPFIARRSLQRWRDFVLAGVASIAAFFVISPYWQMNLHYSHGVLRSYALKARAQETASLDVLTEVYGRLLASLHGLPWAALFWIGVVALAVPAATRSFAPERRLAMRAVVALVLLSGPVLIALTGAPFLRSNNVFPVLPLATVVASVTAVEIWRRTAARRGRFDRPAVAWAAALILVASPILDGSRWLYSRAVPTTGDLALYLLRGQIGMQPNRAAARIVFHERLPPAEVPWDGHKARGTAISVYFEVDSLAAIGAARLDRSDVEIFPERRLRGANADFYAERVRAAAGVGHLRPRLWRSRGPELVILLHPWRLESRRILQPLAPAGTGDGALAFQLPATLDELHPISLVAEEPSRRAGPTLRQDGRELPLYAPSLDNARRRRSFFSERFAVGRGGQVEIERRRAGGMPVVELLSWSTAGAAASPAHAVASPDGAKAADEIVRQMP